ncbi:MAG: hypothetical protein GY853_02770 [PVC group bacterium]|nr:hypothetical protein [PVC group bacterium]
MNNKILYLISSIIFVIGCFLCASCYAQQGVDQEVALTHLYAPPFAAYNHIRTKIIRDVDDPTDTFASFRIDPTGITNMQKIHLHNNAGNGGDFYLQGAVRSVATTEYYIDLNVTHNFGAFTWTVGDVSGMDAGMYVESLRAESFIEMGANTPGATVPPLTGKRVYDLAEAIKAIDCDYSDVVVISEEEDLAVVKSTQRFDTKVAGIISESPKFYMGSDPTKMPLALAGIVRCNVTTENGSINRGDLLVTSSLAGYAMRAEKEEIQPGMVVGSALEVLQQGEGKIYILVNQ